MDSKQLFSINQVRRMLGFPLLPPLTSAGLPGVNDPGDNYKEWQHPRDKEGQWIEKGGSVKIGDKLAGIVEGVNPDNTSNVRVTDSDDPKQVDTVIKASNDDITVIDAKAQLPDAESGSDDPALTPRIDFASQRTFRPATEEELKKFKPPGAWTDVEMNESWSNFDESKDYWEYDGLILQGKDKLGNPQPMYDTRWKEISDDYKWQNVRLTLQNIDGIRDIIKRDMLNNDSAAALYLQLVMGMRVGGKTSRVKKEDVEAFGASSMLAGHAKVFPQGTVFTFQGKHNVTNVLRSDDPMLKQLIQERLKTRSGDDKLFDTNDDKVRKYFQGLQAELGISGLKTHNLRHAFATTLARNLMSNYPAPQTQQEFTKYRREISAQVSELLGNKPLEAQKSYIDPGIYKSWIGGNNGWL